MKITLKCEVTNVRKDRDYNYTTSKYDESVRSELTILKNNDNITGSIKLDGELKFGGIHQITVDTEPCEQVVTKSV